MLSSVSTVLTRDLNLIKAELDLYENPESVWRKFGQISNPPGNLALHVAGNLQHFIGAQLGNTGYVRDRDNEFSAKNLLISDIQHELDRAKQAVQETLVKLNADRLLKPYPIQVFGYEMTTEHFLIHLVAHTNYHLGQINYHRRLVG